MLDITLVTTQEAFTIAGTLMIAVAPLSILLAICEKLLSMFVSMVSGGRIKI